MYAGFGRPRTTDPRVKFIISEQSVYICKEILFNLQEKSSFHIFSDLLRVRTYDRSYKDMEFGLFCKKKKIQRCKDEYFFYHAIVSETSLFSRNVVQGCPGFFPQARDIPRGPRIHAPTHLFIYPCAFVHIFYTCRKYAYAIRVGFFSLSLPHRSSYYVTQQ